MRKTTEDLEQAVRVLNNLMGYALESYTVISKEPYRSVPNPHTYLLDSCNGGYALNQMAGAGTSERTILHRGSKGDLYFRIHSFIEGVRAGQDQEKNDKAY